MLDRYAHASVADLPPVLKDWNWSGGRGVLLHGPKGTGKTHAAVALWREFRRLNDHRYPHVKNPTPFVSVARLMQEKRRKFDNPTDWIEPNWRTVEFVVLDDWDKCRISEWVREELFGIIDMLYNRMVPVIITSNITPKHFAAQSGEYITDRLREMVAPIHMDGPSRRTPNVSHPQDANAQHGQLALAARVGVRPSHQPEHAAESDGALASIGSAQDGLGHRGTALTEQQYLEAESELHVLLAHARQHEPVQ